MVDAEKVTEISEECQRALKCLWEDKGIQKCFERRNEFQISDSTKLLVHMIIHHCMYTLSLIPVCYSLPHCSYLDRLDILCQPNYIPTTEDVICIRPSTTGIVEYTLQIRKEMVFK